MPTDGTSNGQPLYLEDWRLYRNLTQRDLARRAGLAVSTINEIETGKRTPRPSTLRRLAAALDTEDWNLRNPARSSYGILPEAVRVIERLGAVATEIALQGNDGRGLARFYAAEHAEDWDAAEHLLVEAGDGLTLLLGFWQELAKLLREEAPDAQSRQLTALGAARQLAEWRRDGIQLGGDGHDAATTHGGLL